MALARKIDSTNIILRSVPCDASVIVTDVVRMSSGTAIKALADSPANSNMIGVVELKITSTLCDIRVLGVTPSIFTGLDETKLYFLSDSLPGKLTTIAPTSTGSVLLEVGQPFSASEFLVLKGVRIVRN